MMAVHAANKLFAPRIVAQTGGKCTACVVLLHGSGSKGDELRNYFKTCLQEELRFPHIRIVYPTAPARQHLLTGRPSNVWFDHVSLTPEETEDQRSMDSVAAPLGQLIESQVNAGIPWHRTIVGGFSMGSVMALHLGYRFYPQVAGVLVMSSFLFQDSSVFRALAGKDVGVSLPVLQQYHGEDDSIVRHAWGVQTHATLTSLGVRGQFVSIPRLGHHVNATMAHLVKEWITQALPESVH